LDPHLNNDQIDELLRFHPGDRENSPKGQIDERIRIHLKHCNICQTRVRAEGKAMERLAQLKPGKTEARSPGCPSEGALLELAAGISTDPEPLLSHAVQCDHCGPLLSEALNDLTGECTYPEEARIAGLDSATSKWQGELAGRLSGGAPAARLVNPPANPRPWRLAFAGAVIGLTLLGVRDYRRTVNLSAQNSRVTAEIQRLERSNLQQSTQIAELTAGLKNPSTQVTAPERQPFGNSQMAALVLDPGLTRGIGSLKRLTIPHGADVAKITLRLLETPDGVVREDLVTAGGQNKWSQELRPPESEKKTNSLSLWLPVYLLTPNDSQIILSRQSVDGFERLATYTFRVTR
jgi:hypothetical protein